MLRDKEWNYIFTRMLCEKTCTFYDTICSPEKDGNIKYLPTIDEIKANMPNPCSWGTGMEDGGICAGLALEAISYRYKVTGDKTLKEEADIVLKGVKTLTTVSPVKGFLARNVSPIDGKTHYVDSSRDQYTHLIMGCIEYLKCGLCDDNQRKFISEMLVSFAEYAEKCLTKDNYLLREDGGRGIVCCMYGDRVFPHEWLRLPMFYIAAYHVTNDQKWLKLYKGLRDIGIEKTSHLTDKVYWTNIFAFNQMQNSIYVCYELDDEKEYKSKYNDLMNMVSRLCDNIAVDSLNKIKNEHIDLTAMYRNWRLELMTYNLWIENRYAFDGKTYVMPQLEERITKPRDTIRSATTAIYNIISTPDANVLKEDVGAFLTIRSMIDYDNHYTAAPLAMAATYWLLRLKNIITE